MALSYCVRGRQCTMGCRRLERYPQPYQRRLCTLGYRKRPLPPGLASTSCNSLQGPDHCV